MSEFAHMTSQLAHTCIIQPAEMWANTKVPATPYTSVGTHWRRLGVQDVETLGVERHSHSLVRVGQKVNCLKWSLNLASEHHRAGEERGWVAEEYK